MLRFTRHADIRVTHTRHGDVIEVARPGRSRATGDTRRDYLVERISRSSQRRINEVLRVGLPRLEDGELRIGIYRNQE